MLIVKLWCVCVCEDEIKAHIRNKFKLQLNLYINKIRCERLWTYNFAFCTLLTGVT